MPEDNRYPALIIRWLTPVYDLFVRFILRERRFKADLIALADIRPGGKLHIADFGPPHTRWGRLIARRMRRFQPISDNLAGRLPAMVLAAGFDNVEAVARYTTLLGTLSIMSGQKLTRV